MPDRLADTFVDPSEWGAFIPEDTEDVVTDRPVPGLPSVGSRWSDGNNPGWHWLVCESSNGVLYLELFAPEGRHAGAAEPLQWPANRWLAFLTKFNAAPLPEEGQQ